METNDIKRLLARYYDGLTSEEEETMLFDALNSGDIPGELKVESEFFTALHSVNAAAQQPVALGQRLEAMLDRQQAVVLRKPKRTAARLCRICSMAASIAAVVVLGAYLHSRTAVTPQEEATLAQAQTALVKFSSALNEGLGQMENASEKAQDISESINKCITIIDSEEK